MASSDASTQRLAGDMLVKAYFDRPRLILVSNRLKLSDDGKKAETSFEIDLRRDHIRIVTFPGQAISTATAFAAVRGIAQNNVERNVAAALVPANQPAAQGVNTAAVFEAAVAQGIEPRRRPPGQPGHARHNRGLSRRPARGSSRR